MRDYLREFAECVRALPGFMGERLRALTEEMRQAEAERKFLRGGYVGSVPKDAGQPIMLTRGVAVMPRAMIEKYGDMLRAMHPNTDLIAAEDIDDEDDA